MPKKLKHFVVIGGGTGTFTVLSALKKYPVYLSAIVSMADDGGSTGILRDQYGVLPPGDVRRALVALSEDSGTLRKLFNFRFKNGDFAGHNFGNLFLSALEKIKGNFVGALEEASKILNVKGSVIPVTLDNVRLCACLEDGTIIKGETNIDIPGSRSLSPIDKIWLSPEAQINPSARKAILDADVIVMGPGDLYTSIIPNLLVRGMPEAISASKAKKAYICNLMTKFGETQNFISDDFVREIEHYLEKGILDVVVFNKKKPLKRILEQYRQEKSEFVEISQASSIKNQPHFILANLIDRGTLVRHDPKKLAQILLKL